MTEKERNKKSKILAYLLRHDASYNFDEHGWREVRDLTEYHNYTLSELLEIVETDEKGRYEMTEDMKKIRARQGHSVNVDVELEECTPPEYLYHGTATRFLEAIMSEGLTKRTRQYVHLSPDDDTAVKVGERHGQPIVLTIKSGEMFKDGCKFYLSRNGVWLTDYVNPKYIKI